MEEGQLRFELERSKRKRSGRSSLERARPGVRSRVEYGIYGVWHQFINGSSRPDAGLCVAVDRCAVFGVGRVGSVLLPGFCVVDRTKTSTLPKHVATRQGRHKEAGKGTYTSCSEGGGLSRGGLPTPLSGA
eukprot:scaffold12976_cov138-Isochrysis_galbana.AAC.3